MVSTCVLGGHDAQLRSCRLKDATARRLRPINDADPKGSVDKFAEGYNWTMYRRIYLKAAEDLDYVVGIIEQSYKNVL